jgi:acylphosphatase
VVTRHLQIFGRVQGVGFRYATQRKARELDITGWVRNRLDGSVEAMAQGSPDAVEAMIAWARRGPASATVNEIRITEGDGVYVEFMALPTA